MTAHIQLGRRDGQWRLATALGAETRAWDLGDGPVPGCHPAAADAAQHLAGAGAVVTADVAALASWLSHASVLRQTRPLLGRLVDVREAALLVIPELADLSLAGLCAHLNIPCPSPFEPDAFAARWQVVAARLRERARALQPLARGLLGQVAGPVWPTALLGEAEAPSAPPKALAALLPRRPRRGRAGPSDLPTPLREMAANALLPDGGIARNHPAYEHRPGQIEMAQAVADALEREECLLVEAGTGTGKSLAYLIPAIGFARREGVPVVVSTNTRNLQDQLIQRDIPLAGRSVDVEFTAAVLKGRTNYVCPRLLGLALDRVAASVFREDRLALAHLVAWAVRAPLADLDELSAAAYEAAPALRAIVAQVCARNEACAGRRCPDQAFCPVEVARARAQNADVIVVNHALLLAGAGTTVLPEHAHVVIDEAHNLEDVATDQLGHEVSDASVRGLLRLLQGEDAEPIHTRVAECLRGGGTPTADVVAEAETEFPQGVARIEYALEDLAAAVLDFIEHAPTVERSDRNAIRLRPEVRTSRAWEPVVEALPPVDEALGAGAQSLARFARAVEDATKEPDDETAALLVDLQHLHNLLAQMAHSVGIVVAGTADRDFVCWVGSWTTRRGDLGWSLRAAPIDVGPPLQEAVYKGARTLVMTSATLTVDDRFDYLRQRLGLDAERERLAELTVPSPFDFPHQLLMCIPADLPLPGERGFDEAAQEAIFQAACAAGGGTLCLFTSRDSMARAHDRLAERLQAADLTPICQDLATSRTAALEALREEPTAVLFGVKSFWEGVDVPGEALRCLVIVKLPFAVPSDPIIEARQERVEELGSNGYDEFYVPNAVIGFRQGVGRLIRNQTDRGAVFVLDRRILLRRYGARFIESLPACRMARGKLADCVAEARSMFRSVEGEPS